MRLRSVLLTGAFISAGLLAFVFTAAGTVVLLVDRSSGSSDGATPATASNGSEQVAMRRDNEASGWDGSLIKTPVYFLDAIRRR